MLESLTLARALEAVLTLLAFTIALHCLKLLKTFTGHTISSILNASEVICLTYASAIMAGAIGHRITAIQPQFDFLHQLAMQILITGIIVYAAYTVYTTWKQLETPAQEPTITENRPQ